jgi:hypothetical protein
VGAATGGGRSAAARWASNAPVAATEDIMKTTTPADRPTLRGNPPGRAPMAMVYSATRPLATATTPM